MTTFTGVRQWNLPALILKLVLLLLLFAAIGFLAGPRFGAILDGLTPPQLPDIDTTLTPRRVQQNWSLDVSLEFHSTSQGTRTLPLPMTWLLALEQPRHNPFAVPFGRSGRFMDNEYFLRFGFIKGEVNKHNPLGLPVGLAETPSQNLAGIDGLQTAVGFTCAACHTAKIDYQGTRYLIEGGPASTDLGLLTKALGAALGQTALSGKLPVFKGRFKRFARAVLGDAYSDQRRVELQAQLDALVAELAALPGAVDVVEGFARLDALNRIGNQVFALDNNRHGNYVAINAPVNYPHIWTASWFEWVQYDGSIMAPLIRNAGESLGVSAYLNTTAPEAEHRFTSSVNIQNLAWMEDVLSGPAPYPARAFSGLLAPPWPGEFPAIDPVLAERGRDLYTGHCQDCHLPPLDSTDIWEHFHEIEYFRGEQKYSTRDKVLRVQIIPLSQLGTDPAQARVLADRTVDTAGSVGGKRARPVPGMGIDATVCVPEPAPSPLLQEAYSPPGRDQDNSTVQTEKLVEVPVTDSPKLSFALALGAIVQQANDTWFAQHYISEEQRANYEGGRPNCLRAGAGYRARPLNGVWSTAPFLHNGSVPTVYDLLSPVPHRPPLVVLGDVQFDPARLGLVQDPAIIEKVTRKKGRRYVDGYFVLDTKLPGNSNVGHEFSERWVDGNDWSEQPPGVIGPLLSHEDRLALIEFLKTQ